jgi:hypothetical protein
MPGPQGRVGLWAWSRSRSSQPVPTHIKPAAGFLSWSEVVAKVPPWEQEHRQARVDTFHTLNLWTVIFETTPPSRVPWGASTVRVTIEGTLVRVCIRIACYA